MASVRYSKPLSTSPHGFKNKICLGCQTPFIYPIGRGNDRAYCSKKCYQKVRRQKLLEQAKSNPICQTEGCVRRQRSSKAGLCETCYYRIRRTGSTTPPRHKGWYRTRSGYILTYCLKDHALAINGKVYQHRAILYDLIGAGKHPCFWCGVVVGWNAICVDHLNGVKDDNRIENLKVSCNLCNRLRGFMMPLIAKFTDEGIDELIRLCASCHSRKTIRQDGGLGR